MLNSAPRHLEDVAAGWEITSSRALAACVCVWWSCLQNQSFLEADLLSCGLWFCPQQHIWLLEGGQR